MTRPRVVDPADSEPFERQEAALLRWTEELRGKQRLFAEREHVFEGTRLALGGPRRCHGSPPAASPASEHSPRRVGVTGQASAARSPAAPLLARPPAVSLTGSSTSPQHSGYASHLGSTEAPVPEAQLFTLPASSSRRKRRTCRHKLDYSQQLPVVSSSDCFPHPSSNRPLKTHNGIISDSWGTSLLEDEVDWEDFFCSAPPKTVNSGGRRTRIKPDRPVSITHPVIISTPISQPTPTPAPVSRVGVTGVQLPPMLVPAPRLRAARIQPDHPRGPAEALHPVPSCSGGSEELACLPISPPLHPPPDPAFHALALSLVRLAEVSPAQAPALLAQAVALSPSLAQSIAQPSATPISAPSSASPTSVHPLASPLQSVPSPAVQPAPVQSVQPVPVQSVQPAPVQSVQPAPVQSVQPAPILQSPVVQSPPVLQSPVAQSPPVLQSPVAQSPPVLQSSIAQSPPVLQSSIAQSPVLQSRPLQSFPVPQSPVLQPVQSVVQSVQSVAQPSVVQSLIHHPVQFLDLQPQHPEPAVSSPAPQPGVSAPAGPAAPQSPPAPTPPPTPPPAAAPQSPPAPTLPPAAAPQSPPPPTPPPAAAPQPSSPRRRRGRPRDQVSGGRRLPRGRPPDLLSGGRRLPRGRPPDLLTAAAAFLAAAHRTCSAAAAAFLAAAHRTCSAAAPAFLAAAHRTAQRPPPPSSRLPTRSPPASQPATWLPTGTFSSRPPATWPPT
ncbi:proline-rich protein 36-like [Oreochromis niloticus]|uniref:proline-rich protein 36-like n=1 Tax=Oreochromis niloticus TaxID=8128 RepID=UPI000DF1E50B|nr:proline-rich protein 36-like [Oreochromis niloticus]